MTNVYCVTGYPGAGKSEFARVANENSVPVLSMGDQVRSRYPEDSDEYDHTGEFATEQREKHGYDVVARWTAEEIESLEEEAVVIEGVRSLDEFDYFKDHFDNFTLVYVHAPKETRLRRLQNRGRENEADFDMADLRERDEREEQWGLDELVEDGNYIELLNDGSIETFETEAEDVLGV